jgi:hypothetical protein
MAVYSHILTKKQSVRRLLTIITEMFSGVSGWRHGINLSGEHREFEVFFVTLYFVQ